MPGLQATSAVGSRWNRIRPGLEFNVSQWWYNLLTGKVEEGPGAPNSERLGPFETELEAQNALENAKRRNEEWDKKEADWDGDNE